MGTSYLEEDNYITVLIQNYMHTRARHYSYKGWCSTRLPGFSVGEEHLMAIHWPMACRGSLSGATRAIRSSRMACARASRLEGP